VSALPLPPELPPLVREFLKWRVEVQDRSPRTIESDAADLKDFLRRVGISDVASVTVLEIDSYATRMGLDKLGRDTRRRRLYTPRISGLPERAQFADKPMKSSRELCALDRFSQPSGSRSRKGGRLSADGGGGSFCWALRDSNFVTHHKAFDQEERNLKGASR
jgi:hypothetical protein